MKFYKYALAIFLTVAATSGFWTAHERDLIYKAVEATMDVQRAYAKQYKQLDEQNCYQAAEIFALVKELRDRHGRMPRARPSPEEANIMGLKEPEEM